MIRILLFSLVGIYPLYQCCAQQNIHVDSLRSVLENTQLEDTIRISTLLNLADAIVWTDPDEAMVYTDEALQLSQQVNWVTGNALSLRQKGLIHYYLSDYLNAIDYTHQAQRAGQILKNKKFDVSLLNNLANIYSDLKQYDKALEYYQEYLTAARELKDRPFETIALVNIGSVYTDLDDLEQGISYFMKSLKIAEEDGNIQIETAILNNVGRAFDKQQNYAEAMHYYQRCLTKADSSHNKNVKATVLNSIGRVYLTLQQYAEAEKYSSLSLALAREIYALEYQADAWENLSIVYEKLHNPAKALDAYKSYIQFRDSVVNDEKRAEITRKELQFAFEKKEVLLTAEHEKKEALAMAEISHQRLVNNTSLAGGVLLLLMGSFGFVLYKRRRDTLEQIKEIEFKAEVMDTEMKALRAQINPHFIFNSLNSISDYISKHDVQAADHYLSRFAKMMRLVLENSEQKEVALAEDLKALELYMQLESMRLNQKFTYEIKVDEAIDQENTLIPPLILQPFVENSIWHGIAKMHGEGKILIRIVKEGNMINCIVEDNGVGRESTEIGSRVPYKSDRKSFGVKITSARIDVINKIKKTKAAVTFSDLEKGLRVEVKLPLELIF